MDAFEKAKKEGEKIKSDIAAREREQIESNNRDAEEAKKLKAFLIQKLGKDYFIDFSYRDDRSVFVGLNGAGFYSDFSISIHDGNKMRIYMDSDSSSKELLSLCQPIAWGDALDTFLGRYHGFRGAAAAQVRKEINHELRDKEREVASRKFKAVLPWIIVGAIAFLLLMASL